MESKPQFTEKNVDEVFAQKMLQFMLDNCWVHEGKIIEFNCKMLIRNEDDSQERIQINMGYPEWNQFKDMRYAAFHTYILDAISQSSDTIQNCTVKSGILILSCDDKKIDINKMYWSIFNPVYVEEFYGCKLTNDIYSVDLNIMCNDKKISKVELAIGSFFHASNRLMLTDEEKEFFSDLFMKKEITEVELKKLSKKYSIKKLK